MPLTIATPSTIAIAVSAARSLRESSPRARLWSRLEGVHHREHVPAVASVSSLTISPSAMNRILSAIAARGHLGDHHDRLSVCERGVAEQSEDLRAGPGIQVSGRLVGEQDVGRVISAREIATRCCSPPDSSAGR